MSLAPAKTKALLNFKKAHSVLGKIIRMTTSGQYCIEVMQQNLAVIGLLKSANQILLEGHLDSCFQKAVTSNNKAKQRAMTEEILRVVHLSNK